MRALRSPQRVDCRVAVARVGPALSVDRRLVQAPSALLPHRSHCASYWYFWMAL